MWAKFDNSAFGGTDAYATKVIPALVGATDYWIEMDAWIPSHTLTDCDDGDNFGFTAEILTYGNNVTGFGSTDGIFGNDDDYPHGDAWTWWTNFGPSGGMASIVTNTTINIKVHHGGGLTKWYIDGTLVKTYSNTLNLITNPGIIVGGFFGSDCECEWYYVTNVKVGTSDGGTDLFSDDFSSGDFSNWTSTHNDCVVVSTPTDDCGGVAPTISLSPSQGCYGDTVTVTGSGFTPSSPLVLTFDGVTITFSEADSDGSGDVSGTFTVPIGFEACSTCTYDVVITDGGGHSSTPESFTLCCPRTFDTIDNTAKYTSPPSWVGLMEYDLDVQQNTGTSPRTGGFLASEQQWMGDDATGCVYQDAACFGWAETDDSPTFYGIYVGTYDGATFTLLGGPFDAGSDVSDPVVATDGETLYLAYKLRVGNLYGFEVWKYTGSWTHLYSFASSSSVAGAVSNNVPDGGSSRAQGVSGPKICASPNEPSACYVGFKQTGPNTFLEHSPGCPGEPVDSWSDRTTFTVVGLDSGAVAPGEQVIYDDSSHLTGWSGCVGGTNIDASYWLGWRCEFQVANDGGFPVTIWNAPNTDSGGGGWFDNKFHLLDVATLTDLLTFGSIVGDATTAGYVPTGDWFGNTSPLGGGGPEEGSEMVSFAACVISQDVYADPAYGGTDTWAVLLKFGNPGAPSSQRAEWQVLLVRTDGSAAHLLDDNPIQANQLAPTSTEFWFIVNLWAHETYNLWGFQGSVSATTIVMQYDRRCTSGWRSYSVNPPTGENPPPWMVLLGDNFRVVGSTPDLHAINGSLAVNTFDAAWYHVHICRGCDSCGCVSAGLHVWKRF